MPIFIVSKLNSKNGITYLIIYKKFELVSFLRKSSQEKHLIWVCFIQINSKRED